MSAVPKHVGTVGGCSQMKGFSETTTYAHTVIIAPVNPRTGSSGSVSFTWKKSKRFLFTLSHFHIHSNALTRPRVDFWPRVIL